jgi:Tfp pilus assembly protein PilV
MGETSMKHVVIATLALTALAPLSAQAQERMSDARYIAAQQCLAYADLTQLQADPLDFSALREAATSGYRSSSVSAVARDNANRIRARANGADNVTNGLEELRQQRDEACGSFVERGLVQNQGQSSGAS